MGWDGEFFKGNIKQFIDEWCDRRILKYPFATKGYLLKSLDFSVNGDIVWEYYRGYKTDDGDIFAMVLAVDTSDLRSNHQIYWRLDTEFVGPIYNHCPAALLKLLSPTECEYANEWRQRCRQNLKNKSVKHTITRPTLQQLSLF